MGIGGLIEESLKRMTNKEIIDRLFYLINEIEATTLNIKILFWELEEREENDGISKS